MLTDSTIERSPVGCCRSCRQPIYESFSEHERKNVGCSQNRFPVQVGDKASDPYRAFLEAKATVAAAAGFEIQPSEINPILKPHQRAGVQWAVRGGRRALFESFGLGKTVQQIEIVRLTRARAGGRGLIVLPLGVRQEFKRDAGMLGVKLQFIRRIEEAEDPNGIYVTNYETIRDKKIDPAHFTVSSLDEASCLRSFGSKTFGEIIFGPMSRIPYRFVATATPDPNSYLELVAYAAYLGIMDMGQSKTRFFKRDSTKADNLTLHPHKEYEWWIWVSSWALFLQRPSDLGFDDTGYALPEMNVTWHEIRSDHTARVPVHSGQQGRLYRNVAYGVTDAAREKRDSLPARIAKMMELRAEDPGAHRIIWHDLEAERHEIQKAIPGAVAVYGSQDLEDREDAIIRFSDGEFQELSAKPSVAGSGCNFQRHCAWAIFLGIGFKFNDLLQAIHRIRRYLQWKPVRIDLIYTEAERPIKHILEEKWKRHKAQVERMSEIIREYGLAEAAMAHVLDRSIGVKRAEASGENYRLINADAVEESRSLESDSVDLIITSPPFSTQYEYTASYNDFGHTDSNSHFWAQMDFLTPELFRVLRPGRVCAIHCKDRVTPGAMTGLGFQVVQPFHAEAIFHYQKHGFAFLGMKTVVTDVVRENNQTYRLGWTEQCKDGSRMGAGLPEYILLFRKPPTDNSNGYADIPVVKDMGKYTRSRWQIDAHGFSRSNGNRLLAPEDLVGKPLRLVYRAFRNFSLSTVYDFGRHVALGEALDKVKQLRTDFMVLPPQSWHPDVWTDITRMRTLNMMQKRKGRQMHLCCLQFDIVERLINQLSMPGELVFDPFGGLGSVPYMAVKMKRRGLSIELNSNYFRDSITYCEAAEREQSIPTLFDLVEAER